MKLPERIRDLIADKTYEIDHIGLSEASVFDFGDKVLKVQECGYEAENELQMLTWLKGKLPVPQVLAYERMEDKAYLLMSKCGGRYHGRAWPGYDEGLLFEELGIEPDWEKIRYYILLDKLF